jgi:hypothetical protein
LNLDMAEIATFSRAFSSRAFAVPIVLCFLRLPTEG